MWGPTPKETEAVLAPAPDFQSITLSYTSTILPPRKLFYAPVETIFRFHRVHGIIGASGGTEDRENGPPGASGQGEAEASRRARPRAIFGIHPCDVNALLLLDRVYRGEFVDDAYQERRANTFIVALNCLEPGEYCFCSSFGTGPAATAGYDLLLTDLGDTYLVEAGSEAGEKTLNLLDPTMAIPAGADELSLKTARLRRAQQLLSRRRLNVDGLPRLLNQTFQHPIWEELRRECLSCGTCTSVCPTCYCFNVWDKVSLDLETGERKMVWDSCQLLDFGEVALGHNFRKDRTARFKQRVYHKFNYFKEQYGAFGCVGCGRCVSSCIKKVDPVAIIRELRGEKQ